MKRHDPLMPLRHMLEYARKAQRVVGSKTRADLETDETMELALLRAVEVIGEAANRVPADVRSAHPEIPWLQIISTRNRLIHGYDSVELDILWDTVHDDLPQLIAQLQAILTQIGKS